MPTQHNLIEINKIRIIAPILIGVPQIYRTQIGQVYQVAVNQPHVLAFPIRRHGSLRLELIVTASDYSVNFRVRSSAFYATTTKGTYHAEHIIADDEKAPVYVMFDGLKGTHQLIVKASYMTPDKNVHQVSHTLLIQAQQQPEYDFQPEAIERFRFRIRHHVQEALIIPEQLINPNQGTVQIWEHVCNQTARTISGQFPNFRSQALEEFRSLINKLDSHEPRLIPHLAAICMLIEHTGTQADKIDLVRSFLQFRRQSGTLTPAEVLQAFDDYRHPERQPHVTTQTAPLVSIQTGQIVGRITMMDPPPNPPARQSPTSTDSLSNPSNYIKDEEHDSDEDYENDY